MELIRQYRPAYFTGYENEIKEFNSIEELLNIDFVKNFKYLSNGEVDKDFYQYSIGNNGERDILIAEYKEGYEWWVIGYINENEIIKGLPLFKPKEKPKIYG